MNDAVEELSSTSLVTSNVLLPTEILFEIFSLLPLKALKKAVLVSRWWRHVGEDPRLWSKVKLKLQISPIGRSYVRCLNVNMTKLLRTKRLQGIQVLHLDCGLLRRDYGTADDILQAILDHPCLQHVTYSHPRKDICDNLFNPILFAKVVSTRESFYFETRDLPDKYLEAVCSAINEFRNLKILKVCQSFCKITPEVLANTVTKVEEVFMNNVWLSQEQIDCILKRALDEDSALKKIHLMCTVVENDIIKNALRTVSIIWNPDLDEL